jgi:hypothetical protein
MLDAQLLAEVYLAMTRGQESLDDRYHRFPMAIVDGTLAAGDPGLGARPASIGRGAGSASGYLAELQRGMPRLCLSVGCADAMTSGVRNIAVTSPGTMSSLPRPWW